MSKAKIILLGRGGEKESSPPNLPHQGGGTAWYLQDGSYIDPYGIGVGGCYIFGGWEEVIG
jgi:hypothetical protein